MGKGDDPNTGEAAAMPMSAADLDERRLISDRPRALSLCKPDRFPNEDDYLLDEQAGIAAVFDGMGGQDNGAVASSGAVAHLRELIEALPAEGGREGSARDLLEQLRGNLIAHRIADPRIGNADSTATIVVRDGDHVDVAWAGDTRAYLIAADGAVTPLTQDHSLLVDATPAPERDRVRWILDEADSVDHAQQLGGENAARAFYWRARLSSGLSAGEIGQTRAPVNQAAAVMVISDGVSDNLKASQIQEITRRHAQQLDALPAALLAAAETASHDEDGRGKPDDITCVLLPL